MTMRIIWPWVGCLAILGAEPARAQEPADARAKLRASIVRLRAEVEMVGLDQEIDRTDLMDGLKTVRGLEMLSGLASIGGPTAVADDAEKKAAEVRKKDEAEKARYIAERKAVLARRAAVLAEKRLDLEDLERQYRETWQAPQPGDGVKRARLEAPTPAARLEVCGDAADSTRVTILDPIPGWDAANCCPDPPTDDEVWAKFRADWPLARAERKGARFEVEKIGEQVDPVKVYPLAGPCHLVHCHYKCTVRYEEAVSKDDPRPRAATLFIDKDRLRRAATVEAKPDPGRRKAEMGRMLDRILRAFGDPGREMKSP